MKYLLFLMLITFAVAATAQEFNHLTADTLITFKNADGTNTLLACKIFRSVPDSTLRFARQERLKARSNAVSYIEQQLAQQKEQIFRDSVALETERVKFSQEGGKPDSLFSDRLKSLAGDWTLSVKKQSDEITVSGDGSFTIKKGGSGTIKVEADDKIIVTVAAKKYKLFRKSDTFWIDTDGDVRMERMTQKSK
jgi:hypothetical protein